MGNIKPWTGKIIPYLQSAAQEALKMCEAGTPDQEVAEFDLAFSGLQQISPTRFADNQACVQHDRLLEGVRVIEAANEQPRGFLPQFVSWLGNRSYGRAQLA